MKSLYEIMSKGYEMPHKFSFITLEEFCELNNLDENTLTEEQINFFYDNYGKSSGLPASRYDLTHTHNDWVIENLQSHDHKIVIRRIKDVLGDKILNIDTEDASEKLTKARIVRFFIDKSCNIFNSDSETTFKLKDCKIANEINKILKFHNYYITQIYLHENNNILIIEPKQTENATDLVKKSNYVYHITYKQNLTSILRTGLRPKVKKSKDEPAYRYFTERVFLIMHSPRIQRDLIQVLDDLDAWNNYVILKIDVSKLNITFWWDDASIGNTIYTVESIPPKFIEVIDDVFEV